MSLQASLNLAVLLAAAAAQAFAPTLPLTSTIVSQKPAAAADDEDDPAPGAKTAPAPATPVVAAPPTSPAGPAAAAANAEAQKLISGAPLFNPNVAVHIVEKKQFADRGKREVILYPAAVQANGKFTQHFGSAASFVYHVHENFGFQLTGQYNWLSSESAFNGELIEKVREEAQAATSLLLAWGAQGGVEVSPLYGKFAWYEDSLAHFAFVINGGVGIGSTRHQLKPVNAAGPATFGETGLKFLGSVGAGFRLQLGDRFALRLELRDLVYTARTDSVNGCDGKDLETMDRALRAGTKLVSDNGQPLVSVAPSCKLETFSGVDPDTGHERSNDVSLAKNLVFVPSSDVLNNVGLYLGFAVLF